MATPAEQDLVVTRGDTMTVNVTMTTNGTTPINITSRVYTSMVRANYDDPTAAASFVCTIVSGAAGTLQLVMSAASTALLEPYNYYWDLQENASGIITTVLAGAFVVLPDVTRS
jgi:hypothetical protein